MNTVVLCKIKNRCLESAVLCWTIASLNGTFFKERLWRSSKSVEASSTSRGRSTSPARSVGETLHASRRLLVVPGSLPTRPTSSPLCCCSVICMFVWFRSDSVLAFGYVPSASVAFRTPIWPSFLSQSSKLHLACSSLPLLPIKTSSVLPSFLDTENTSINILPFRQPAAIPLRRKECKIPPTFLFIRA